MCYTRLRMPRRNAATPKKSERTRKAVRPPVAPPTAPSPTRPSRPPSVYKSTVFFALGVAVIAGLMFALVRETAVPPPATNAPATPEDAVYAELARSEGFLDWLKRWRKVDPYVTSAEFELLSEGAVTPARPPEFALTLPPEALIPPRADRYVWSPDKSRFVDYLSSYGEPDSAFTAYDRNGDGKLETLAFCGTPCRFDGAFWLDDERVVLLGNEEGLKEDGSPLCIGDEGENRRCYRRLTVTLYDFARDVQRTYVSGHRLLHANPFDALSRDRWIKGLTQQERDALGVMPSGETAVMRGVIIEYAADARVLALGGAATPRFAVLAPTAIVRDARGEIASHTTLRKGQEIELTAIAGDDGAPIALSIRVISDPAIVLDAPADGAEVGGEFSIDGDARVFEGTVRVRLTNDRTGRTLIDDFTTAAVADVGLHAPFSYDADVPASRVRNGDALTLEVFQESAEDGSEIDKVTLKLLYRP